MVENIGKNLKRYRQLMGLKQYEVAERINVTTEMVGRIEQGRNLPSLETLDEMARALNIPLDYFVCDESRASLMLKSVAYIERLRELSDTELLKVATVLQSLFELNNIQSEKDGSE